MLRIALLYGGESEEHSVACVSALGVRRAIDNDSYELGKNTPIDVRLRGDAALTLRAIEDKIQPKSNPKWMSHLAEYSNTPPLEGVMPNSSVSPEHFFKALAKVMPKNTFVATDVGQHQMWCANICLIISPAL